MSRTRKDRPHWVKANDPTMPREAFHSCCFQRTECSLDQPSLPHYAGDTKSCFYLSPGFAYYSDKVSNDTVRMVWHSPERGRERDTLKQFVKQYNSASQTEPEDFDFANFQHRHGASRYN